MGLRRAGSDAFWIIAFLALALVLPKINSPLRAEEAHQIVQRQIIPAQVEVLKTRLSKLSKGKIKILLWAGTSSARSDTGPGPGPFKSSDDNIHFSFSDPDPKKPLDDNGEIIVLGKQLSQILESAGYRVYLVAAVGSETRDVGVDRTSNAGFPLAAALQSAATQSGIKLMVGGDGTESSLLHQSEIVTIWIGRQTHDTSVL